MNYGLLFVFVLHDQDEGSFLQSYRIFHFNEVQNSNIENLYEYMSSMSQTTDYDPYLISNGILCKEAHDAKEATRLANRFQEVLQLDTSQLKEEAARLGFVYFVEPKDELIGKVFELSRRFDDAISLRR